MYSFSLSYSVCQADETHVEVILSSIEMCVCYWKLRVMERGRDLGSNLYNGLLYFSFLFSSKPLQMVEMHAIWVSPAQ